MYFLITQRHTEETCSRPAPVIRALARQNWPMEGVRVHGVYAASHIHTWYYLIEADNYEAIWQGFSPFRELTQTEIIPVHNVSPGQPLYEYIKPVTLNLIEDEL